MDVISNFAARFERSREEELSIEEYLAECKRNPLALSHIQTDCSSQSVMVGPSRRASRWSSWCTKCPLR